MKESKDKKESQGEKATTEAKELTDKEMGEAAGGAINFTKVQFSNVSMGDKND